jgi:hypothetical protein
VRKVSEFVGFLGISGFLDFFGILLKFYESFGILII